MWNMELKMYVAIQKSNNLKIYSFKNNKKK